MPKKVDKYNTPPRLRDTRMFSVKIYLEPSNQPDYEQKMALPFDRMACHSVRSTVIDIFI